MAAPIDTDCRIVDRLLLNGSEALAKDPSAFVNETRDRRNTDRGCGLCNLVHHHARLRKIISTRIREGPTVELDSGIGMHRCIGEITARERGPTYIDSRVTRRLLRCTVVDKPRKSGDADRGVCWRDGIGDSPIHLAIIRIRTLKSPTVGINARIMSVVSLKNSTINEQKNTISKPLNLLDAVHLPSGSYRGV